MVFPSVFLTGEFNLRPMGVWPLTAVTLPHRMLLYFGIASSILALWLVPQWQAAGYTEGLLWDILA
jgi:hypothetical protein